MFKEYSDILTVGQVAQALHISKNSAYRLIHSNAIGYKRIGRKIIVPKRCLIDYALSARYNVSTL
ncbi:MAG: helix-turn-helix domain-containing protein [Flavonifractor sp.]|jgi:excisionase family DNA binding protein|nr:helix-turn-helix domain-containing protein [Flavonifractor sp.]